MGRYGKEVPKVWWRGNRGRDDHQRRRDDATAQRRLPSVRWDRAGSVEAAARTVLKEGGGTPFWWCQGWGFCGHEPLRLALYCLFSVYSRVCRNDYGATAKRSLCMSHIDEAVARIDAIAEVTHSERGLAARVDTHTEAATVIEKLLAVTEGACAFNITVQQLRDHYTIIMERRKAGP